MRHDPLFEGIQRYGQMTVGITHYPIKPMPKGEYVLYADLPALIANVRKEEVDLASVVVANLTAECDEAYGKGYDAALRDAKKAVWEALRPMDCTDPTQMDTALAAIETLGSEQ